MKNREPVTIEYAELHRYQEIEQIAVQLLEFWEKADRSADNWFRLNQLMERLDNELNYNETHQTGAGNIRA